MPYLFLTGPSGVGKSTILKEELAPWGALVSGFLTSVSYPLPVILWDFGCFPGRLPCPAQRS